MPPLYDVDPPCRLIRGQTICRLVAYRTYLGRGWGGGLFRRLLIRSRIPSASWLPGVEDVIDTQSEEEAVQRDIFFVEKSRKYVAVEQTCPRCFAAVTETSVFPIGSCLLFDVFKASADM